MRHTLSDRYSYDPDTGEFKYLTGHGGVRAGDVAGWDHNGYVAIGRHAAHRVAFLLMTGEWPAGEVDHINGVKDDNRWCNLRVVDKREQQRNLPTPKNNRSGIIGVWRNQKTGKWQSSISIGNKSKHLYSGDNPYMAVYRRAKAEYDNDFHPNHGR